MSAIASPSDQLSPIHKRIAGSLLTCSSCHQSLAAEAVLCADCSRGEESGEANSSTLANCVRALDNRWLILSSLIFVVGITGLPILWRSRAFSPMGKVFWSTVVSIETAVWWLGLVYLLQLASQGLRMIAGWF